MPTSAPASAAPTISAIRVTGAASAACASAGACVARRARAGIAGDRPRRPTALSTRRRRVQRPWAKSVAGPLRTSGPGLGMPPKCGGKIGGGRRRGPATRQHRPRRLRRAGRCRHRRRRDGGTRPGRRSVSRRRRAHAHGPPRRPCCARGRAREAAGAVRAEPSGGRGRQVATRGSRARAPARAARALDHRTQASRGPFGAAGAAGSKAGRARRARARHRPAARPQDARAAAARQPAGPGAAARQPSGPGAAAGCDLRRLRLSAAQGAGQRAGAQRPGSRQRSVRGGAPCARIRKLVNLPTADAAVTRTRRIAPADRKRSKARSRAGGVTGAGLGPRGQPAAPDPDPRRARSAHREQRDAHPAARWSSRGDSSTTGTRAQVGRPGRPRAR